MTRTVRVLPEERVPAGALCALLDPRVTAARRALGHQRFPLTSAGELTGAGPGRELLEQVLGEQDFPLVSLRRALDRLRVRVTEGGAAHLGPGRPALERLEEALSELASPSLPPASLAGSDPASRGARRVYSILRERARARGIPRTLARREARLRALEFRALCQRWLPARGRGTAAQEAGLHAWAQCYAREFAASPWPCLPSACCDEAARLAARLVHRLQRV